jgi:hypothetical protein
MAALAGSMLDGLLRPTRCTRKSSRHGVIAVTQRSEDEVVRFVNHD